MKSNERASVVIDCLGDQFLIVIVRKSPPGPRQSEAQNQYGSRIG